MKHKLTCVGNHVLPSYNIGIALVELSIAVVFYLVVVILQNMPYTDLYRFYDLVLYETIHILCPGKQQYTD